MSAPVAAAAAAVARAASAAAPAAGAAAARAAGGARAAATADARVRVAATANNVHVTISDLEGRVVSRASGGMVLASKHRARASPAAGAAAVGAAAAKAYAAGHRLAHLELAGPSRGRGGLLRALADAGIDVADIRDTTPVPMPGTRPPAARRL
jgi:small subunit ribosomal protein S11